MAVCLCARRFLIVAGNAVEIHRAPISAPRRGEGNRRLPAVLHRSGPWEFPEACPGNSAFLRDAWSRGCEPQAEVGTCYLGQHFRATPRALSGIGVGTRRLAKEAGVGRAGRRYIGGIVQRRAAT